LAGPAPNRGRLRPEAPRDKLSWSSTSFRFSARATGTFKASWIGVDILSSASRITRAVVLIASLEGFSGVGVARLEFPVEPRPPPWAAREV